MREGRPFSHGGSETMKKAFSTCAVCAQPHPVLQYMTMSGVLTAKVTGALCLASVWFRFVHTFDAA